MEQDVLDLRTGALFLACSVDHAGCAELTAGLLEQLRLRGQGPRLVDAGALPASAMVVSLGFVMKGLPLTELTPVGDEFVRSLRNLEAAMGVVFDGIIPLAAANANAIVPLLGGLEAGVPVIDADPMGRVFPLLNQTTFAAAGLGIGPIAVTGPTGETALIDVHSPTRGEQLVRAVAAEMGGWVVAAAYPVRADVLRAYGVCGSMSRLLRIGRVLNSGLNQRSRYEQLDRLLNTRRVIRARVTDVEGLSRPGSPEQVDRPSSVTLFEDAHSRVIRLEIQNEILLMMVDGVAEAVIPDIITMLRSSDGQVASLEDLWVGNEVDLISFPAAEQWYRPEGLALAGPVAFGMPAGFGERSRR